MSVQSAAKLMLRELRVPLVLWVLVGASSLGAVYFSYAQFKGLSAAHQAAENRLKEASGNVRMLRDDLGNAQKFLVGFESLSDQSIVGAFKKQHALDQFESVIRSGLVEPKSYALAAEAPVDGPEAQGLDKYQLVRHAVSFEVSAAHELRLVRMIDQLQGRSLPGLKTVESCEIGLASKDRSDEDKSELPQLSARCNMSWYRFHLKTDSAGSAPGGLPNGPLGAPLSAGLQAAKGVGK